MSKIIPEKKLPEEQIDDTAIAGDANGSINEARKHDNQDSVNAYGANKHRVTDVESDSMKNDGYVIEQLGENSTDNK